MTKDLQELTKITRGASLLVERVRLKEGDIVLEGNFELPPLARLTMEDQIFVTAFIRSHGSIKDMELLFGISYPTVKNRISHIAKQFEFVEIETIASEEKVISELESGDITADEAVRRLSK